MKTNLQSIIEAIKLVHTPFTFKHYMTPDALAVANALGCLGCRYIELETHHSEVEAKPRKKHKIVSATQIQTKPP